MAATFPPVAYVVDGLICADGLTLLGGKRKHGKSWLCLQIAQSTAAGAVCLDRQATQGPVLYLALEDGAPRLQQRLRKQQAPGNLPICYEFAARPLNAGGMGDLAAMIDEHHPLLVIIDTLAAAKTGKVRENDAGDMADILNALRRLAQAKHVGILVVVHHGKGSSGDVGDDVRGSSAVAAAADITLGLYRTEDGALLKAEGRDIEEMEMRVQFDAAQTWSWQVLGDARQMARQEAEQAIREALQNGPLTTKGLADELGKSRQAVQQTLKRLAAEGRVVKSTEERNGAMVPRWALPGGAA
jgi:RecA-family ATPase/biotin operon repressor